MYRTTVLTTGACIVAYDIKNNPGDMVYIHDSARIPGVSSKFRKFWSPAQKVLRTLSDWT
jgi:hypothetical protein